MKFEFDGVVVYFKSFFYEKNDDEIKKRAVLELVKLKIAAAPSCNRLVAVRAC